MKLILALLLCFANAGPRERIVQSVDIHIPVAPLPVRISGTQHLVYELHITNFRPIEIVLKQITILDQNNVRLAVFHDSELIKRLGQPGSSADSQDPRQILPGRRAVFYLWLPLNENAEVPVELRHTIELELRNEIVRVEGDKIFVRQEKPVLLDPPLRGGPWVGLYDPMMAHGHRTSIYAVNGKARIPARFAIDWILLDADSKHANGDEKKIANWYGYGADVLAVGDGIIVDALDDIEESPLLIQNAAPLPLENASGNYITLDLGNGRFAFYEHLKHGSIQVKKGDRVKSGKVIAQLGNSGSSSSGPHLHFHISDSNSALSAEGEPFEMRQFEVLGSFESIFAYEEGKEWTPETPESKKKSTELPAPNAVVNFPK